MARCTPSLEIWQRWPQAFLIRSRHKSHIRDAADRDWLLLISGKMVRQRIQGESLKNLSLCGPKMGFRPRLDPDGRIARGQGLRPLLLCGLNDGNGFVFISHTGEVYPSGFLPISGGNVRQQPLSEISEFAHLQTAPKTRRTHWKVRGLRISPYLRRFASTSVCRKWRSAFGRALLHGRTKTLCDTTSASTAIGARFARDLISSSGDPRRRS